MNLRHTQSLFCFLGALFLWGITSSWASSEMDHQFELETIGFLKSWDNVDGLFSDYVSNAYQEYFSRQTRFILNDLSRADSILSHSKLPYRKVIHDADVLNQLARTTRTASLIRTEITKEGAKYFVTMDWLHSPRMELLASESFTLDDPAEGANFGRDLITEPLQKHMDQLFSHLPFLGNVTGRDNQSVTISLGHRSGLKRGDHLAIGTIEDAKKHPMLNSIVDWRIIPTGKVLIEQVEENMSFGKVEFEEPGRSVSRFQKVLRIETASPQNQNQVTQEPAAPDSSQDSSSETPRLGWVSASLNMGGHSRSFSLPSSSVSDSGGGFAFGGKAEGEVWFTKEWFADLSFDYSLWNYSQKDSTGTQTAVSQAGGVGGSLFTSKLSLGYSYLVSGDFFGPKGWLKLGYKSSSYTLPASTTEWTGPVSFNSFFLGVGGDLPIRGGWGAWIDFNFRLLTSVGQSWVGSSATSSSDVELYFGTYYRFNPKMSFRGGFHIQANSADFPGSGNLDQKTITFQPALLYYF